MGYRGFPGKAQHSRDPANPTPYVRSLEREFRNDIGHHRFVPHIQLHEYETLLFADPDAFELEFDNCGNAILQLKSIVASHQTIEHINDGKSTAPSKQIINVLPAYEGRKATAGPNIAEIIGLPVLRQACPHFDAWISQLEDL